MDKFRNNNNNNNDNDKSVSIDTLLVLEKTFETIGQQWVENLNIIEQLLIGIVENFEARSNLIKVNFIVRRLPAYTAAYLNKNEYAVIIEDIDFVLKSPYSEDRECLQETTAKSQLGQVEIFSISNATENENNSNEGATKNLALNSKEFFNNFATVFQQIFTEKIEKSEENEISSKEKIKVQLLGPHLLYDLKCNSDVKRIFTLTQPNICLSKLKTSNCRMTIDRSKSMITLELDQTIIIVRPCLFYNKGYGRLNNSLLERIPLFHPAILCIGESLMKGCFLSPSNSELLWTIQFWPCESHIISTFHPSSIIGRLFKLYSSFCLSPLSFWECLNECFIVGVDSFINSFDKLENNFFTIDFLISSFLFELERFPQIEDWGPTNFTVRFMSLLKSATDSYEKGFFPNYFTKVNILRGLWKKSTEFNREKREKFNLSPESKNIEESTSAGNVLDYGEYEQEQYNEHYPSDREELDDDFGFQLDHLSVDEEGDGSSIKLTHGRDYKRGNPLSGLDSVRSSIIHSKGAVAVNEKKTKSLSRKLGANILRRFSTLNKSRSETSTMTGATDRPKSMTDIASGFEEMVNQMRREQTIHRHQPSKSPEDSYNVAETSFSWRKRSTSISSSAQLFESSRPTLATYENNGFQLKESIYSIILQFINEISISEHSSDTDMVLYLEKCKKILYSQGELIVLWCQIMNDTPKLKYVCPHTFSPRQIQYISLVVQTLSKCSPNNISSSSKGKIQKTMKMPAWEISGDILRTVLYQLRSEITFNDSIKKQREAQVPRKFSFKTSKSFSEGSNRNYKSAGRFSKFSFRKGGYDVCKSHGPAESDTDPENNTQFALEDPETAATHRLLQWLWQLRNSEIGRLSTKAQKYIEALHMASHINSHFLEQFSEQKILRSTAIRSAVAVSRIMADEKYLPHIPLLAASKKGWLWAEMVLSLVTWNHEKGIIMKAQVPIFNDEGIQKEYLLREIQMTNMTSSDTTKLNKSKKLLEPDTEAATLAFHSELATPLGWNDFEDPRRPGPQTVPILIFSPLAYFNQWEMISGNIVQTMVRLQKFNNLQHVGSLLYQPHRKTALNEVRKLNKSTSFRTFQFDDNVMTKTFRRLASLRNTRSFFTASGLHTSERRGTILYTCQQIGCISNASDETTLTMHNGKEIECTKF